MTSTRSVEAVAQLYPGFLNASQPVGLIGELRVCITDSPVQLANHVGLFHQVQVGVAPTVSHMVPALSLNEGCAS
ncbi:hypothetical protein [Streptomyces phaeochromogenes]|uniref:hypothetical protein n=2 Tax=Streptomyces phaeochromogenes TaxID=1923 RepID=UPI002E2CEA36|nr:hypothetical protein [Streptomyces phaeochromogenes]